MYCFKLTKRVNAGGIPVGYVVQVTSNGGTPTPSDLEAALKRAGFNDRTIQRSTDLQLSFWEVVRL